MRLKTDNPYASVCATWCAGLGAGVNGAMRLSGMNDPFLVAVARFLKPWGLHYAVVTGMVFCGLAFAVVVGGAVGWWLGTRWEKTQGPLLLPLGLSVAFIATFLADMALAGDMNLNNVLAVSGVLAFVLLLQIRARRRGEL